MARPNNSIIQGSYLCCSLVILFQLLALCVYLIPQYSFLSPYVPFVMPAMVALIVLNQPDKSSKFWWFLAFCFAVGYLTELFATITGIFFGEYSYGDTLGVKVAGVPLLMGFYWVLLIYSAGSFFKNFNIKDHSLRALYGAFFVLLLDVLIEPVAIKYNYWTWLKMIVPLQKYLAVFLFAFVMLRILYHSRFNKRNPAATIFFIMQVIFYAALNLWAF